MLDDYIGLGGEAENPAATTWGVYTPRAD